MDEGDGSDGGILGNSGDDGIFDSDRIDTDDVVERGEDTLNRTMEAAEDCRDDGG